MPLSEFELIQQFFSQSGAKRSDVRLGVGDDCALLAVPAGKELVVSIDTLVEGIHFYPNVDPESLGHKALAVNLSDLAAMGAEPAWVTLALTLPTADSDWLEAFSRGFAKLAMAHRVQLVGGDTTRGPLNISVQAHGFVDAGCALRRAGAQAGNLIYVTGTLGDAGLALRVAEGLSLPAGSLPYLQSRLERPTPRLAEGMALVGLANAAIDISDGLIADLGHICKQSALGACLDMPSLPCSTSVQEYLDERGDWSLLLSSGDDYELCFTVPPVHRDKVEALGEELTSGLTCIGIMESKLGIRCLGVNGQELKNITQGYDHFHSRN
ncbi:Thiamine-monophosphate kinase [hydrothermal vent metagenome]|uniref:Thiamine-monophosphate kinase n=1 Tax=hydrothermal vent metagenome TaxID=652676 RepID=A0A3B1BWD1_9ZZZZ